MRSRLLRISAFFLVMGLSVYVGSSVYLIMQGLPAWRAFTHISIFYVPYLLVGIVLAIAAYRK